MGNNSSQTQLSLGLWDFTADVITDYLSATGDPSLIYMDNKVVPPLALSAKVLGSLLQVLSLPPGTIHSLQEIHSLESVSIGESIEGLASVSQTRRRGNLEFTTVEYSLNNSSGRVVQTGKTTVLRTQKDTEDENS